MAVDIDPHSATWRAVQAFVQQEMQDAIDQLIEDHLSEQQRGALKVLDRLSSLTDTPLPPVVSDNYN